MPSWRFPSTAIRKRWERHNSSIRVALTDAPTSATPFTAWRSRLRGNAQNPPLCKISHSDGGRLATILRSSAAYFCQGMDARQYTPIVSPEFITPTNPLLLTEGAACFSCLRKRRGKHLCTRSRMQDSRYSTHRYGLCTSPNFPHKSEKPECVVSTCSAMPFTAWRRWTHQLTQPIETQRPCAR